MKTLFNDSGLRPVSVESLRTPFSPLHSLDSDATTVLTLHHSALLISLIYDLLSLQGSESGSPVWFSPLVKRSLGPLMPEALAVRQRFVA